MGTMVGVMLGLICATAIGLLLRARSKEDER